MCTQPHTCIHTSLHSHTIREFMSIQTDAKSMISMSDKIHAHPHVLNKNYGCTMQTENSSKYSTLES